MAPAIPPPFKEEKETGRTRPETARTMTSEPKQIRIKTADEFALAATVFPGEDNDGAKRCAIMSSAMGVKRGFYESFARFLSKEGITVITYDYRGIGDSGPGKLEGFEAHLHEWGEKDLDAVIRWVRDTYLPTKLFLIGHSVGGQIAALAESSRHADAIVGVAAQSGYWGHWSGIRKVAIFVLWHLLLPISTHLVGFFPAKFFGLSENLPKGVALQWATWGRDPDYIRGKNRRASADNFDQIRAPVLAYFIEDDTLAPRLSVEAMLRYYTRSKTSLREISLKEIDRSKFGHFGWFREELARPFWNETVEWLDGI